MAEKPTVEQALRYCENSKISDPYILLEVLSEEVKRQRGLFKKVQDRCAGDAHPRWGRDPATRNSRGYLLDICNAALD